MRGHEIDGIVELSASPSHAFNRRSELSVESDKLDEALQFWCFVWSVFAQLGADRAKCLKIDKIPIGLFGKVFSAEKVFKDW